MPGDHWLNIITPGNTGEPKSVSFQMANGLWLAQSSKDITVMEERLTNWFNLATTFSLLTDKWPNGFVAFESLVQRGYFLKLSGTQQLQLGSFKDVSLYLDKTSWRMSNKSKYHSNSVFQLTSLIHIGGQA